MEEARTVLARLARIEVLEREGAHPPVLLAELRELVREAEAWVGAEGRPVGALEAVARCKEVMNGRMIAT
jgi:hypothetical protein